MQTEIIIAGFGGQGVLFAGQLLAYSAMDENMEVTWFPSYGPEMRGGTANCTVIISDEEIGSAMIRHPKAVLVMNLPSLDKYENLVKSGGILVVDSAMIERPVERTDINVVKVPAVSIAEELGDKRMANMVMLGALLANLKVLPPQAVKKALEDHLPARHKKLLPLNFKALEAGAAYLQKAAV